MGLLFVFTAIISWGLGDFLIQRNARKFGIWVSLLFITLIGAIFLLPFVWGDLPSMFGNQKNLLFLAGTSCLLLIAALLDFEALRRGKISVIEPIYALEVPVTVALSMFLLNEPMTTIQTILVVALMVGIFLISTRSFKDFKYINIESGAFLAIGATIGMGIINFLFGIGAREISPLAVNWFTSAFLAVVCLLFFLGKGKFNLIKEEWRANRGLVLATGVFDNLAWVAYAYAAVYMPIAIATSLTESYIALAALLGLLYNGEELRPHQYVGLVLCVVAAITLAYLSEI